MSPKDLARLGYIKFDTNTGMAENGYTLCLISQEEKAVIDAMRSAYKSSYPKNIDIKIHITEIGEPTVISLRR